jgi:small neutral amino acid transporter SnatA (MarC family)
MAVTYAVFLLSIRLRDWLGAAAIAAMERLMGLVLTALAVEMLLDGVTSYIRHIPPA